MLRIQFRQNDRRFNINGNQDLLAHAHVARGKKRNCGAKLRESACYMYIFSKA